MKILLLFILLFGLLVLTGCAEETVDIDNILPDDSDVTPKQEKKN